MKQSQSQSVTIFATEKVDKVYIEKDKLVIQALSNNIVKFTNKHKAEQVSNKHNLQTKLVEFSCKGGTIFKLPTVDQVRQNFKDTLQCFCFVQSADNHFQFYLILQFFNYYSQAAVNTLISNFKHDLIKQSIHDVTMKGKQTFNKNIKQIVNDYTKNNVNLQHLVFYNFEAQEEAKESVETDQLSKFNYEFTKTYVDTFKAICMFPMNYKECQLYALQEKDQDELTVYLRHNLLSYVKLSVMVTAYDVTLKQILDKHNEEFEEFQSLFEEQLHRQTLMNQIVESNPSLTEHFLNSIFTRLKQTGNNQSVKVIHPHPMASFSTHYQNYIKEGVLELLCYDPEYIIQILTVSRWFAKVILQDEKVVAHDNNNCGLFLYGTEGTGKSRIAKAFKDAFMAYNWFKGDYQSPDIVNGSCFYAEEVEFNYLITPLMKNILDFEASERVNIKNMHPVECSYMTPVILTSNQYPQEIFQQFMQTNQKSKQSSAAGLMRRLFCVQFTQKFDDKYKNLEPSDEVYKELQKVFLSSTKEQLFNTIYGLALMQVDLKNIIAPANLYNYHNHVLESILQTHFGVFYYKNKKAIDQVISDYIQFVNKYEVPQQQVNQNIESLKLTLRDMQQMYMTEAIVNSNNPKGLFEIFRSVEKIHLRILRVLTQVPILNRVMKHEMVNDHYKQWEEYAIHENELNVLQSEEMLEDPFEDVCFEIERVYNTYCQPSSQPQRKETTLLGKRSKIYQTDHKQKKRIGIDEFFNHTPKPTFEFEEINATGWEHGGLSLEDLEPVKKNLGDKFDE